MGITDVALLVTVTRAVQVIASAGTCSVALTRQLSASPCDLNATYGCNTDGRTMWTKDGCRGIFSCNGADDIDCEDNNVHGGVCDCSDPQEQRGLLSRVLGSAMVLQRAPEAAVVWGYVKAGASVTVTLDGKALGPAAHPDANGI